jgi:hypothetical protein
MPGVSSQSLGPNVPGMAQSSPSTPGGFVPVNPRPLHDQNGNGASHTTRHELLTKFHTLNDRRASSQPITAANDGRRRSTGNGPASHSAGALPAPKPSSNPVDPVQPPVSGAPPFTDAELRLMMNAPAAVAIPNTPSSLLPAASQRTSQPHEKDDGGPFKAEMVHRMESLQKGERVLPPCDRCRRLHMDCLKNLTACLGCTKKHAKCSWREVRESELRASFPHHAEGGGLRGGVHGGGNEADHRERRSTGSPGDGLHDSRQGLQPAANMVASGPHNTYHPPEMRITQNRLSPPGVERERGGVEAQLQEAARSGLAHAAHGHAQPGIADGKDSDYQAMVAS